MNLNLRPGLNMESVVHAHPPLRFQILDVDVRQRTPSTFNMTDTDVLRQDSFYTGCGEDDDDTVHACEVCVFGVSSAGHSILVRVHGFMPYFYVEVTQDITDDVLRRCVTELRQKFDVDSHGVRLDFVMRKRMYGWVPESPERPHEVRRFRFGRVSCTNPWLMRVAARLIECRGLHCLKTMRTCPDVSEHKVAPSEKFLAVHGLKASGWAVVETYALVGQDARVSVSQMEVRCGMNRLASLTRDAIAPLVIAAVDIEAHSHDYRSFPDATHPRDAVTFIGTTFWVYGESSPRARVMQVLGECEEGSGSSPLTVMSYKSEYELLTGWRDLMALDGNPDMVVSYNGTGFDFAYLSSRMNLLKKGRRACRFSHMGRFLLHPGELCTRELTSAAKGQNVLNWFPQAGRVQLDLFMYVKDSQKLSSYKLDDVAARFLPDANRKVVLDHDGWVASLLPAATTCLVDVATEVAPELVGAIRDTMTTARRVCPSIGDGKENAYADVNAAVLRAQTMLRAPLTTCSETVRVRVRARFDDEVQPVLDASGDNNYRKLFRLYDAGAAARAAIAVYCQVDCDLVVMLLDVLNVVANTLQMSQVCNTLANDVANRGQQIKTYNLISRFASAREYVLNVRDTGWDPDATYEGATVLDPVPGYYQIPVATLDFASLYPSLMRGYNLCHSSLVLDPEFTNLPGVRYERYDIAGRTWTFQQTTPGILSQILTSLLDARRAKKKEMKQYAKGSLAYRLCDGAQLALKVSCNSVYGFCGVTTHGMYPCMPVAVATTFNGRRAIDMTRKFMIQTYNATVVYGDTDSVMVSFPGVTTVSEAFASASRAAAEATAMFPDAIVLEFEKVFLPYLLVKKKTYAGMKYEDDPTAPPCLDVKGLALVRRDNCELVRDVMRDILQMTMHQRDPMGAYKMIERVVEDVVKGNVPLPKLEISNSLKNIESYTNTAQPQLTVVRKMKERAAFDIPRSGDRVPYIICRDDSKKKVSDRAEHPAYVAEHGVPVDKEYYLVSQLQKRLQIVTDPLPVPDIGRVFESAVVRVRDDHLDQNAISKLCHARTQRKDSGLPPPPPRVTTKKRGWGHVVACAPLSSSSSSSTPQPPPRRAKAKKGKGWDAEKADVGVPTLMSLFSCTRSNHP